MKRSIDRYYSLLVFFFCLSPGFLFASSVKEKNVERKVSQSDVVIIGQVVASNLDTYSDGIQKKYASVRIVDSLKGKVSGNVNVLYRTGISEADPDCCVVGEVYLFFLRRIGNDMYLSSDGKFGVRGTKGKSNVEDKE